MKLDFHARVAAIVVPVLREMGAAPTIGVVIEIPGVEQLEVLASGANGSVFVGVEPALDNRRVAVKVMLAGIDGGERRFDREVRAMGRLSEIANIAQIYRSGVLEDGRPFLVMRRYEHSLQHVIATNGPMPVGEAVRAMSPIATALAEAHSLGVLHLDIKPSNLLVDARGQSWLADFGIAEFSDASASLSGSMLTTQYAPPEGFEDTKPTTASDVWSMGATLYALLVGHPPFETVENTGPAAVMLRIMRDEVPLNLLPADTPESLRALIQDSMAKDPSQRPSTAEFAQRLDELNEAAAPVVIATALGSLANAPSDKISDATVISGPLKEQVTDPTPLAETSGGRPRIFAALTAAIILLAGAGVFFTLRGGDVETEVASVTERASASDSTTTVPPTTATTAQDTATTVPTAEAKVVPLELPFAGQSISVAVLGSPDLDRMAELTPEYFTTVTGLEVNFVLVENGALQEISTAGDGEFDVVQVGAFEAPQFGNAGNLLSLTELATADVGYDIGDLIPSVRSSLSVEDDLFASPYYGESSIIHYRQDLLDAAGLDMPTKPTWEEVAAIAREIGATGVDGICLRTLPGWGQLGASFGTVMNTFGATWWAAKPDGSIGAAQVDQPEFRRAFEFYVDLVQNAGPSESQVGFPECLELFEAGEVAMWYDSTFAALPLEQGAHAGNIGYALAPTETTDASGWLWSWGLGIPATSQNADAAWEFVSWATSEEFAELVGEEFGWNVVPSGHRASTFANQNYLEASNSFALLTYEAIRSAPYDNPGTAPRPGLGGVQYVSTPEFAEAINRCTTELSGVFAGAITVDDALVQCQSILSEYVS